MSNHNYSPLKLDEDDPPLQSLRASARLHRVVLLASALVALLAALSVSVLIASLPTEVHVHSRLRDMKLRYPNPFPNFEIAQELRKTKKSPKMIFPGSIVRVSKDSPTTVFTNSSHVVLTPQDSMFYQWYLNGFTFDRCIISAAVPDAEHLNTGNKSYAASGDLGSIEVWNVSYPDSRMRQLSWVQKPSRIALLGTLNFTHRDQLDMWQLQPPTPRFDCPDGRYTVEIACNACRIELEQVFSMPAMGFELQMLG